jgi:deazaflavin-dependent oxidoreductase (nitroreductase family)
MGSRRCLVSSTRRRLIRVGTAVVLALGFGYTFSRGFRWLLRQKPERAIGAARKFFGRVLNPIVLWVGDRTGTELPTVYHTGRRSGREYATPLCVTETPDGFIVPAAFGPDVDWLANLAANPHARLRYGGRTFPVIARVIDAGEAMRIAADGHCPCWDQFDVKEFALLSPSEADQPGEASPPVRSA